MNDSVIAFLRSRKSSILPTLTDPGPNEAEIETILEIASRVPDHGNLVPWRFILYRGDARLKVGEMFADMMERRHGPLDPVSRKKELVRFSRAPLVIGVVSSPKVDPAAPEWEQFLTAGAIAFNIVHSAIALGYGANWVTGWFSDDAEAAPALGAKKGERFVGFVHVGTMKSESPERPRPDWRTLVSEWNPAG